MCNKCHECFLPISIVTSSGNIQFPENERIRQNPIKSVSVRRANGQTKKDRSGNTLAADAVVYTAHLNLVNGSAAPVAQMPVENLWRDTNSPEPLCVQWDSIDPTQSSVILDTTAAGYNAAHVIELVFEIPCANCRV